MWISNAPIQVAVVWARDEAGDIRGLIVERGMEGLAPPTTHGKWSLRASATGELVFHDVKVQKENILPNVKVIKRSVGMFNKRRVMALRGAPSVRRWIVMTHHLRYCQERIQFDKPIGAFQLQQKKLAEMITEITKGQLLVWRLGVLMSEGKSNTTTGKYG